jgi:hypothetical protein
MATDAPEAPEGFTEVEQPETDDDYDTEWVDRPEVSETLTGTLLARKPDRGEYDSTVLELRLLDDYQDADEDDLVAVWSTNGIDQMLNENDVSRGDDIALYVGETFENEGEHRRSYALAVR